MISKIIASVVLSILGIAALADFLLIYHGHFSQFGFLSLSFGVFALCAAVFAWRHWVGIRDAYTSDQTTEKEGVELPRAAWSERLGMGGLFNLGNRPERPHSRD
ncbi:MAG: hypothetical protein WAV02_17165 [Stellaceae bacterium]